MKRFAEWTAAELNNLPDSSFAYIAPGGTKDAEGKTTPRSLRLFSYQDKDGKADLPHVRNALARLEGTQVPEGAKAGIKLRLQAILEKNKASDKYVGIFPLEFQEGSVAIPEMIHIIPIGQWEHPLYGQIQITASDIQEFVKNFNAKLRNGVPITAGHEGFEELPAVGWFKQVEARDNGLWGMVEWNETGKSLLSDKAFKFFSPEFAFEYEDSETHEKYRNVLLGGALTKSPYFKELEAVVFSDKKIIKQFSTMDLKDLLAKKVEELSAEEKQFMKDHASELTEEQKTQFTAVIDEPETAEEKEAREKKEGEAAAEKERGDANEAAGLNRDGSAKTVAASEKGKSVTISASEYAILTSKANDGAAAFAELKKAKLDAATAALVFSETNKAGKFLPKSAPTMRAFMESLNDAQLAKFTALVKELPESGLFTEKGVSHTAVEGTAAAEVEALIKVKMSEKKDLKYSDALKLVMSENKGLEERYDRELPSGKKNL